jgi:hypothetical protein
MNSRHLAEDILDRLFNTQNAALHEQNKPEDEDEDEGDEEEYDDAEEGDEEEYDDDEEGDDDEDEDYEDEGEADEAPAQKTPSTQPMGGDMNNASQMNQATLAMKPTNFSPAGSPSMGREVVRDAHGGGVMDATGKGDMLGTLDGPGQQPQPQMQQSWAAPIAQGAPMIAGFGVQREQLEKDVRAIFADQEDLNEEFISKAIDIYEASVNSKIKKIAHSLNEEIQKQFDEKLTIVTEALVGQLDHYLDYVVEEWMKENELAVESGIRTEIAENFIENLKKLFTESYIEVPQEKVDIFDELTSAIDRLEGRINEEMDTNTQLMKEIKNLKANQIFMEETAILDDLGAEKVREIAENISYEGESDFRGKIRTLVEGYNRPAKPENYVPRKKTKDEMLFENAILEEDQPQDQEEEPKYFAPEIKMYSDIINRTLQS